MNEFNDLEHRKSLSILTMRLFDLWGLTLKEQAKVLGYSANSQSIIRRYRNGKALANRAELMDRVAILLGIQKSLLLLLPANRDLAHSWISRPNKAFDCQRPLDVMQEGYEGLLKVRSYLGHACYG